MSLKYVIRPMTEDDTFAVELIEQGIFSLPWSQKSFADACRNQGNVYLVCEADGVDSRILWYVDCAWRRQYNQHGGITGLQAVWHSTDAYAINGKVW